MAGEIEHDEDDLDVPLSDDAVDEFVDDGEIDLDEEDLDVTPKERAARAFEIRRALEARDEQRRLTEDLDYLDLDLDIDDTV